MTEVVFTHAIVRLHLREKVLDVYPLQHVHGVVNLRRQGSRDVGIVLVIEPTQPPLDSVLCFGPAFVFSVKQFDALISNLTLS